MISVPEDRGGTGGDVRTAVADHVGAFDLPGREYRQHVPGQQRQ